MINTVKMLWGDLKSYYKAHIWCYFMTIYILSVIGTAAIFQHYLQNYYYNHLVDSQKSLESSILGSAKDLITVHMSSYIYTGAVMATSAEVCEAVNDYHKDNSYKNKMNVQTILNSYGRNSNKLYAMAVVNKDGLVYQTTHYRTAVSEIWTEGDKDYLIAQYNKVLDRVSTGEFPRCVVNKRAASIEIEKNADVFHIFFPMLGMAHNIKNIEYVLCLTYSADILKQYTNYIDSCNINYLFGYVTDDNGNIIYHNDDQNLWVSEKEYLSSNNLNKISADIPDAKWTLNIAYDEAITKAYIDSIFKKALPLYGVLIFILCLVIFANIQKILKPIRRITRTMYYITKEGKHLPVNIEGENEVWQLAAAYNDMLIALKDKETEVEINHQKMVESIARQHEAERNALETQINAHFICNTLNTINYEAMDVGNHKVAFLIKKLSNILRYSFGQKSQNVFLYQELAWTEQYLYLMKFRLEDTFDYEINVEEEVKDWPCCKLMLQPFVENAIIHGFEGLESGGRLVISGKRKENTIEVIISDNGKGMRGDVADNINAIFEGKDIDTSKIGIGIRNAFSRMKLFFGSNVSVLLSTEQGKGCEFRFLLPVPEGKLY